MTETMTPIGQAITDCLKIGPCQVSREMMDVLETSLDRIVCYAVTLAVIKRPEFAKMLKDDVDDMITEISKRT